MTRLLDDEIDNGERLLLIADPAGCPGSGGSVHACTVCAESGMPVCSLCGDEIPPPVGYRV